MVTLTTRKLFGKCLSLLSIPQLIGTKQIQTVLISELVITCAVGGAVGGLTGVQYFRLYQKACKSSYLGHSWILEYRHRMLLLMTMPTNIHRTRLLGRSDSNRVGPKLE
jgi:hypothetical protein